jgi:16S rRNA G1207 methylase RsmC
VDQPNHYFSPDGGPLDPGAITEIDVEIAGRPARVATAPGVFSAHRIDLGTSVLLRTLSKADAEWGLPKTGSLVDLGSGWGPLALTMATLAPGCAVFAVDVNPWARALTALNAERLGLGNIVVLEPDASVERVDRIWSNPPIRIGKTALHALLGTWLERLAPDGRADLVVQRNLGADSLQAWLGGRGWAAARLGSAKGYRVLRVERAAG